MECKFTIDTEILRKQLAVELCRDRESNPGCNYDKSGMVTRVIVVINIGYILERLKYIKFKIIYYLILIISILGTTFVPLNYNFVKHFRTWKITLVLFIHPLSPKILINIIKMISAI